MIQNNMSFREARCLVAKGRLKLGLPKGEMQWTEALKTECLQLLHDVGELSNHTRGSPLSVNDVVETVAVGPACSVELAHQAEESKSIEYDTPSIASKEDDDGDDDEDLQRDSDIRQTIFPINVYLSPASSKRKSKKSVKRHDLPRIESDSVATNNDDESRQDSNASKNKPAAIQRGLSHEDAATVAIFTPKLPETSDDAYATNGSKVTGGIPERKQDDDDLEQDCLSTNH